MTDSYLWSALWYGVFLQTLLSAVNRVYIQKKSFKHSNFFNIQKMNENVTHNMNKISSNFM